MVWLLSSWNDFMRDLKGAMQSDHSKDMSVHVASCTSYDFNALTAVD
jgi:hypothetical protein